MKMTKSLSLYASLFLLLFLTSNVRCQDWRKIVPLRTTCEEVKVILNVDNCKPPVSDYKFPDLSVNLNVSEGNDKWKVSKGTITRVRVGLRNLPPLKDLRENLDDFEILPDDDLPNSKIYRNDERGIEIVTQKIWSNSDEEYVTDVILYPPKPKKEQRLPLSKQYQNWRKIVPLKTACEDIKKLLGVDSCKIPVSTYKFPDVSFNINLAEEDNEWKVPEGTVTRVSVGFLKLPLLKDFEANLEYFKTSLKDFEILPDDDLLDSKIYTNDKKGISFVVRTWDTDDDGEEEKYVSGVTLSPPNCKK